MTKSLVEQLTVKMTTATK